MPMNPRLRAIGLCFVLTLLQPLAPQAYAQLTPAPPATQPDPRGSERPTPEQLAKLRNGPKMAYKPDPNWPTLPPGYNLGETAGVDVDKQGNVWVFNRGHWPMMQFDRSGKMLQAWTEETFRIRSAHGLRVGPDGSLWCVDVDGHVILKMSPQGKVLMVLGNRQGTPGTNESMDGFNRPTNVSFRANGNMYVADGYINSRVIEFNPDGEYLRHWGTRGAGDGLFNLVHDVAVDSKGLVYVADRTNERIQVFDASGKFITKWTDIGAPWSLYYVASENALYMCDGKYNRIVKLGLGGQVLGVLGEWGKAYGKLDYPHSISVDPADGSIYVAEIKNWRVQKWVKQ